MSGPGRPNRLCTCSRQAAGTGSSGSGEPTFSTAGLPQGLTVGGAGENTIEPELDRISVVFRASDLRPTVVHLGYDPFSSGVTSEVRSGNYDLVVLGAENRAIQHRLFFGYDTERLIRAARVPIVVVVPHLGRLA